jgi:hypothetical protein
MRLEQLLEARRAHPALEPADHPFVLHERQRRDGLDPETLRKLGLLVHVDLDHAQAGAFLACDVGDEALHAPCRAGALGGEEDQ